MIPLYMLLLLDTSDVGEFSYEGCCRIFIYGKLETTEWVVNVRVYAKGFAWGCNKFHTGIHGSFKLVVRYYLMKVLNDLSEYGVEGKNDLLAVLRNYLE